MRTPVSLFATSLKHNGIRVAGLLSGYLCIWMFMLNDYLPPISLSFILGAVALPFTINKGEKAGTLSLYMVMSFIVVALAFLIPVKTLLFFSIGFALLFLCNHYYGTTGFLSICTLVLMSPVFLYAVNVFSFSIRLQLTAWAGQLLAFTRPGITTQGNMIHFNGAEFAVDPACMGLNMLVTSLLLGVILIGYHQKKYGKRLKWYTSLACLALIVVLNVISNLLRILLLVQFNILPQNALHDLVGLLCLVLYVVVPAVYIIKQVVLKGGFQPAEELPLQQKSNAFVLHGLILIAVAGVAFSISKGNTYSPFQLPQTKIGDYQATPFAPGIVKLDGRNALIYVKYIRGFYDTDHNPAICWKGSGYAFQQVQSRSVNQHQLYTSVLVNGTEKLYTAWWYSNGYNENTTDQFRWRWQMIKDKKKYAVINITAATEKDLYKEVEKVLRLQVLSPLFQNG